MSSPKELFLTNLKRIFPIPTYEGYLLCFGEEGDVYIINMFRMRLLKHSSIDIDGIAHISLIKVDQENIWVLITDDNGKITTWRIKTNKYSMNLQTVCSENEFDIDFELKKVLSLPEEDATRYLLVYSEDHENDLLTITSSEVTVKKITKHVEDIISVEKFSNIGDIIFATTIQKNEGVYIMIITDTYDIYIDRYDQLTENTAPLIQLNMIECSELNGKTVSSARLEELLVGRNIKYDDNYKMLYFFVHERKSMIAWFVNDMLRNSRFYTYGNNQDTYRPSTIPMQCCSIDIFSDQESSESEIFLHEGNNSSIGHNLISFNDIIIEEFKNINYYQFFYKDERVTCTLIISAVEKIKSITPALVIGTNYGRIFIVSLFQKAEGNANPIIVLDSHFGNTITGLFFASNKYLFSISEEGTLCVTKLSDAVIGEHFDELKDFKNHVLSIQRKRFDKQAKSIQKEYKHKRRASYTSYTKNMWQFVKISHTKRFKDMSPFGINKILEVKDIESLRGQSRHSHDGTGIDPAKLKMKKLREYAFVGDDNVVFLFSLHTMQMQKLLSADSHAIGVYYDSVYDYYFVLTKELNML